MKKTITSVHQQKINAFIPEATKNADRLVGGLTKERIQECGGVNRVWSTLFTRIMNRLTVNAGLRKAYLPKNIFEGI